jgi:hypothetical protein
MFLTSSPVLGAENPDAFRSCCQLMNTLRPKSTPVHLADRGDLGMKKIYIVIAGTLLAIFVVYLASMQSPQDPEMRRLQPTRKALAIFPG